MLVVGTSNRTNDCDAVARTTRSWCTEACRTTEPGAAPEAERPDLGQSFYHYGGSRKMKKSLKIAGLCLASMLVMGMALAGNASAALLWLVCLKGEGLTKYTSSNCLTAGSGSWQSLGVPSGTSITVKILILTLLLKDTKTAAGASEVQCFDNAGSVGEGVIEANGKGKVVKAEVKEPEKNCVGKKVCESKGVTEVTGINLPWTTELFVGANGEPLTKLVGSGEKKEPGWKLKCKVAGLPTEDVCESSVGEPEEVELSFGEVTKNPAGALELLVKGRFQDARLGTCSQKKEKSGEVTGKIAILLPGGALSIFKS